MQYWKVHYKDADHDADILVANTEGEWSSDPLSFELDGIRFCGPGLDSFEPADKKRYEEAAPKFKIFKYGGGRLSAHYGYWLQGYAMNAEIPVKLVRKEDRCEVDGIIRLSFEFREHDPNEIQVRFHLDGERVYPDDVWVNEFSLMVDGRIYQSREKTTYFDLALSDISEKMSDKYFFKSCYTCQYSDYSPFGHDNFGNMLCYRKHKEDCLKVDSKADFFEFLEVKENTARQETYLCDEYEPRVHTGGYRGYVKGVEKL